MSILELLFGSTNGKIDRLESNVKTEQGKHKASKARANDALHEFENQTKDHLARSYEDADRRLSNR